VKVKTPSDGQSVSTSNRRRVATLLQRVPWIGYPAQALYRLTRPWVTIGAVGAIFNQQGKMLIVEHVFHPLYPWGLPGGWMNRNEEPEQTVRREVLEETGLHVDIVKPLIFARTSFLPAHLDVAYLCSLPIDTHEIHLSSELLDYQWIEPLATNLPPMGIFHSRVVRLALAERSMMNQNVSSLEP
jgi:ADP-ribose pyrophosphatase YjhB (NUDIX family)